MISVADAVAMVTAGIEPLTAEVVGIERCLGRVLAEDVVSRVSQPPAAVSSMDGYALRAGDAASAPATLRIVGESAAGRSFPGRLGAGEAVRISTGAVLPDGADGVVIQEVCERTGDAVTILEPAAPGRWIRPAGLDFRAGEALMRAGRRLTARDLGLAAAMNVPWLKVRRMPRVAILATGNEVVMPGDPLGPDQIVSSNSIALSATVAAWGGDPVNLGIAGDDEASLESHLDACRGVDLLVTIGGASVGDHDLVGAVLRRRGMDLRFYKVAMRPGKPLMFGRLGNVPVLGLPGNPVSVGVTSVVVLKPAMDAMLGVSDRRGAASALQSAVLGRDLAANDERQDYLRARLAHGDGGERIAMPFERQDSAMLALLTEADCLIVRAPHAQPARAGDRADIIMLGDGVIRG